MGMLRKAECDIKDCKETCTEKAYGDGWPGWGTFQGITLNGADNPMLCPKHVELTANFVDALRGSK